MNIAKYRPENEAAYSIGHAANTTPPASTNQTWLPSHTGSMDSSSARRSSSVRPRKRKVAPTPRSKPSMTAKPMSSAPRISHQIMRRVTKSGKVSSLQVKGASLRRARRPVAEALRPATDHANQQIHIHRGQGRVEGDEPGQRQPDVHGRQR